jgi:hypothetical protein
LSERDRLKSCSGECDIFVIMIVISVIKNTRTTILNIIIVLSINISYPFSVFPTHLEDSLLDLAVFANLDLQLHHVTACRRAHQTCQ